VDGDPVNGIDPYGLGCYFGIACGAQSALGSAWGDVNPASGSNYFRRSAQHNGLAARIVKYADPAYMAVNGYVGAYDQWTSPCEVSGADSRTPGGEQSGQSEPSRSRTTP
jgi:hypothetical protein